MTRYELTCAEGTFDLEVAPTAEGFRVRLADATYLLRLKRGTGQNEFVVEVADKPVGVTLIEASSQRVEIILDGERLSFQRPASVIGNTTPINAPTSNSKDFVTAPMPGKVIGALVREGEKVKAGDPLIILESMKMEIAVRSDRDAEVAEVLVEDGAFVKRGQGLVRLAA